ncbi:hypothetical protein [Nocardioides sp. Root140]|uniref:hypothetical protein n=1 Tax=Nocardioides sp. Root140 TaxID=1736460 RepID=UPI0006F9D0B4|nr:hypothetical protein [Nocardioides sp. Root140]KQY50129.1 hypothetical protein ASD30_21610 [Nocardioides sp. Root140]
MTMVSTSHDRSAVDRGTCCDPELEQGFAAFLSAVFALADVRERATVAAIAVRVGTSSAAARVTLRGLHEHGLVEAGGNGWVTLTEHGMEHARAALGDPEPDRAGDRALVPSEVRR